MATQASAIAPEAAQTPSAYDLIAEVNALRAANGLPPYEINAILMSIAQGHSEYQASIRTVTHTGADGSTPSQRALYAGYAVAGDLSLGGYFSENVIAGNNLSVQEAVSRWQGDAPHLNTMLSSVYRDVGAGVAVVDNYVYYTLDVGLSTGGTPAAVATNRRSAFSAMTSTATIVANTPQADGSIVHIVQQGETLWTIAIAYGVHVDELRLLNNLTENAFIYPGNKLTIRPPFTPTPVTPTVTPTPLTLPTARATSTPRPSPTISPKPSLTSATVPSKLTPTSSDLGTVLLIVILALLVAGGVTLLGARRER